MAFTTLDILTEFAEVTSLVPGGDLWLSACEQALHRRRLANRKQTSLRKYDRAESSKRYASWVSHPDNHARKLAYMRVYERLEHRKVAKAAYCRERRAAEKAAKMPVVRECKYKKGCKRVESKETRRARYLRARATGYLSK